MTVLHYVFPSAYSPFNPRPDSPEYTERKSGEIEMRTGGGQVRSERDDRATSRSQATLERIEIVLQSPSPRRGDVEEEERLRRLSVAVCVCVCV